MTAGKAFWSLFLITLGGVILANNFGADLEFGDIWRYWSVMLILLGAALLVKKGGFRIALGSFAGIILALAVASFFSFGWVSGCADEEWDEFDSSLSTATEPYSPDIKTASLELNGGVGKYVINGGSSNLFDLTSKGHSRAMKVGSTRDGSNVAIVLESKDRNRSVIRGKFRQHAEIALNEAPVWRMNFDAGVSTIDADLTSLSVEDVEINAGVSTITIRLGDKQDEARVSVDGGVSKVRIEIPESAGAEIEADAPLSSRSFEGFQSLSDNRYRTSNYEAATKKVRITLNGGVSDFKVSRY